MPSRFSILLPLLMFPLWSGAEDAQFTGEVWPILEAHCVKCHGAERQKGKVRFDTLSTDFLQDPAAAETWHDAWDQVQLGEMPPEDEEELTSEEREVLTSWIDTRLKAALAAKSGTPSNGVMRRLNRTEYQYAMTDLLGLEMDYAAELPADALSPDGFRNDGAALGMTGLQVENYLKAARQAMNLVLVEGDQPGRSIHPLKFETRGPKGRGYDGIPSDRLGRVNYWRGSFPEPPREGQFTVRITARAERTEEQAAPILAARYGYFVSGLTINLMEDLGEIPIASTESQVYELRGMPEFFPRSEPGVPSEKLNGVVTLYNILNDGISAPKPKNVKEEITVKGKTSKKTTRVWPEDPEFPKIIIESVEFVRNDYASWPPPSQQQIVKHGEAIETTLERFLRRAWRRPPTEAELKEWGAHYAAIREASETDLAALREVLAASLASSHFHFLIEPDAGATSPRPLNAHEIAARLALFLWSSIPDAELNALADSGALQEPAQLRQQFARMLADPKAERFAREFSSQWLDLDAVDRVAINPQFHKFDDALKQDMVGETQAFFREILRSDTSALQFLDADFTMLNAPLAKFYGIRGPKSQRFEKVALSATGHRPGGLLGHASVHLAGSDGVDSHPIKRAVWIRERLLHDPPKPPPPDVPDLATSVPNFEKLSVREQLEVHAKKAACAECHRTIDPWGIALEEFGALGLSREKTTRGNKLVSTQTTLPGNYAVDGIEDLKAYLTTERRDQFAHALVSKLLTYALGRSMELNDELVIQELAHAFADHDYRLSPLLEGIVTSNLFLYR